MVLETERPVELPDMMDLVVPGVLGRLGLLPSPAHGWPLLVWHGDERMLLVDEYVQEGILVIRAHVPGIDPDRDLAVTASQGIVHIRVECPPAEVPGERTYLRHELAEVRRYVRDLALPETAADAEPAATYADGVLEIRVPLRTQRIAATRIPVDRT